MLKLDADVVTLPLLVVVGCELIPPPPVLVLALVLFSLLLLAVARTLIPKYRHLFKHRQITALLKILKYRQCNESRIKSRISQQNGS